MKHYADRDFGPYRGHPNDPRNQEPPEWDEMTPDERRELLKTMTHKELICLVMEATSTIEALRNAKEKP